MKQMLSEKKGGCGCVKWYVCVQNCKKLFGRRQTIGEFREVKVGDFDQVVIENAFKLIIIY